MTRVARLERLGDSYAVVHLRTPRTQTLSFLAGQSADLLIEDHVRRFAIASCPCNGMVLQFHAHFDARDAFLRKVFALHAGDAVAVRGPFGGFQLDESSRRPLIMVAEGTGFAPIKSVIEHAVALEWPEAIRLLWLAEPGGHYLENYCRALEDAFDEFSFALCAISPGGDYRGALEAVRGHAPGSDIFAAVQPVLAASLAALAGTVDTRLFLYA